MTDNITTMESAAFSGCYNLKNIVIPNGIDTLERGVFQYTGITNLVIPENIKVIGENAFSYCINLETVNIIKLNKLSIDFCQD